MLEIKWWVHNQEMRLIVLPQELAAVIQAAIRSGPRCEFVVRQYEGLEVTQ